MMRFFQIFLFLLITFFCIKACKSIQNKNLTLAEGNLGNKINTGKDELFPALFNDKLFYYSEESGKKSGSVIYEVDLKKDNLSPIKTTFLPNLKLEKVSTPTFWLNPATNDLEIYFSALNPKSKTNRDLFFCRNRNGIWESPKILNEINSQYIEDSPSISSDGLALVFASDRPGGYGKSDLYISLRQTDGTWGKPLNLGAKINTGNNEITPFIAEDGTLFFASNGHTEKMGFDLIKATSKELYEWDSISILPYPLNSRYDDISPFIYNDKIYFSSKRQIGFGKYDLYKFDFCGPVLISGKIQAPRNYYLNRGLVELCDLDGKKIDECMVNNLNEFNFNVQALKKYVIRYKNDCLKNSIQEQVIRTPCSDESTIKLLVDFVIKRQEFDTLITFERYPFPFFYDNYYMLTTKDNLENLRTLLESNILKKEDFLFKIPDENDFSQAILVEEVIQEVTDLMKSTCSYLISCLSPIVKLEITIICSREERDIPKGLKYLGLDIENKDFGINIKRGDIINKEILPKLRAYFVVSYLKQILATDLDYINARDRIIWKIRVVDAFTTKTDVYAQKKFRILLSFVTEQ